MNASVLQPSEIDSEAFHRSQQLLEGLLGAKAPGSTQPCAGKASPAASAPTAVDSEPRSQWPASSGAGRPQAIQKVSYNHEALIDLIIANPAASQNKLADHFGLTPSWISQVMSSDAFQSAMAARREAIVDPTLRLTVEQNFKALVSRSLDILREKLNKPASEIPDQLALRALEISSRAAGYGVKDPGAPPAGSQVDIHLHLEQMGQGLVALLQRKKVEALERSSGTALIQDLTTDINDGKEISS